MTLLAWVLAGVLLAPQRVPAGDVAAILRAMPWTPDAAAWLVGSTVVAVDPSLVGTGVLGEYIPLYGDDGYIRVWRLAPATIEHEAHHAWNAKRGYVPRAQQVDDLEALAAEGGTVGRVAWEALASGDWLHYQHRVIEGVGYDAGALPAWYAARYFGYLEPVAHHRLVLPVAR